MPKFVNIEVSNEDAEKISLAADLADLELKQFLVYAVSMYGALCERRRELACEFPEGANLKYAFLVEATDQDTGVTNRVGMLNSWEI